MDNRELLDLLNGYMKTGTICEALDITITQATPELVSATLPVSPRTTQQSGFLHGGALAAMAESLATLGTALNIDSTRQMCFCLSLTANHFRSRRSGVITAEGRIIYKGRTTMVWDINVTDEEKAPVSSIRCTVEIVDRPVTDMREMEAKMKAMSEWDSFIDLPRSW